MQNNSIISEGKTTAEAVENGLKILNVSKDKVEIKVLENEDKRSFFSILTPRIVKVELKIKEDTKKENNIIKELPKKEKEYDKNIEEIEEGKKEVELFLKEFILKINENLKYEVKIEDYTIEVKIEGEKSGILIGYRGETLNSLQNILAAIANKKSTGRIKLTLDIEGYRLKREKTLEELAEKVSKTVLRTGKSITLEPMTPYERKIIHNKLQSNTKVQTYSIGENDNRRVVIEKIK